MTSEERDAAIAQLREFCAEYIRDHRDEEYFSQARQWSQALAALDALIASERHAQEELAQWRAAHERSPADGDVADVDARDLAPEGAQ